MVEKGQQMGGIWGWRGILGFIFPTVFPVFNHYYGLLPEGVGLIAVTLGVTAPQSAEQREQAFSETDEAARRLAQYRPDIICFVGGGLIAPEGSSRNEDLIKRIEEATKIPVTTAKNAEVAAFRALSVKKLIEVSPNVPELGRTTEKYLRDSGFEVINSKHLGIPTLPDTMRLPMSTAYTLAKEAYLETPEADAIMLSCGMWAGPAVIDRLEQDLGKPVVTAIQALMWAGLKALNIREPVKGCGRLLEML
jgi:maleate isomerase